MHVSRSIRFLVGAGLIAASILAGCERSDVGDATDDPRAPGTRAMAEELAALLESSDPTRNVFLNARRVAYLKEVGEPPGPPEAALAFRAQLAAEHLFAGQTLEAVELYQEILDRVHEAPHEFHPEARTDLWASLGLAWLRLGEQENCLVNHTASSCIIPIRGEGVHTLTQGSLNAVDHFTRVLEARPDDLNTRWLLNLAYMTLDLYPEGVPPRWRIPMDRGEAGVDFPPFRDIAPELGLDVMGLAGGSIVDDFTGNGYLDILTSSWHLADQLRFFVNNGDGTFTDRTLEAGLEGITGGLNMVHADYTNSGYPDVLVLRGAWLEAEGRHPNSLLRNNGDGTFTDVTREAGVYSRYPTQTAVWADLNNNGWVDLFIGNEAGPGAPFPSELYLNNGDGTFREVAAQAGVDLRGYVKGVVAGDHDESGYADLYVSVLHGPNLLLRNDGPNESGVPTFTEVAGEAGVREPYSSFPAWFWDYDNDGRLDLFVSGYRLDMDDVAREYLGLEILEELPRLYRNNGDGTFSDVTPEVDLEKALYTMGSNFGDLDNDGYLDFYLGTGDPDYRRLMPSRMFRNEGGERFQEVTIPGRFGNIQKGHAVSFADMNHDGCQDIHMNMGGALEGDTYQNLFFRNPGFEASWLTVRLLGTTSNRLAVGARIQAVIRDGGEVREVHRVVSSGGSFGGNPFRQHLGLGSAERVDRLVITWPASGEVQTFMDVEVNRLIEITEGVDEIRTLDLPSFEYRLGTDAGAPHGHDEAR